MSQAHHKPSTLHTFSVVHKQKAIMKKLKSNTILLLILLIVSIYFTSCSQSTKHEALNSEVDIATLEKEIESRLREYERHLKNGDSIALGNRYTEDAEIIPSTVGRENIMKVLGSMIQDSKSRIGFVTSKGDFMILSYAAITI